MRYMPLFQSPDFYVFQDQSNQIMYFVGIYRSPKASAIIPIVMQEQEIHSFQTDPNFLRMFNKDIEENTGPYLDRFAYGTVEIDPEAKRLIQELSFPSKCRWNFLKSLLNKFK